MPIFNVGSLSYLALWIDVDVENEKEAYDDLLAKLTSVYGEPEFKEIEYKTKKGTRTDLYAWWLGENDTAILLNYLKNNLYFFYGTLKAEEMIDVALEHYQAPSNNVSDSTDGL